MNSVFTQGHEQRLLISKSEMNLSLFFFFCLFQKDSREVSYSNKTYKLDVDPQRDDDASPMSTYRCMLRPTWMISALQHKSKYKSNSISNFFEKKNQIFWFPCCSTREDLSVDVSITHVGLILMKPGRFFFSRRTETRGTDRIQFCQFRTFWKIFTFLGFHGVVLVKIISLMYQLLM